MTVEFRQGGLGQRGRGRLVRDRPGQTVGLVGESGSGKTVTALAVLGLIRAHGGRRHRYGDFEGRELVGSPTASWPTSAAPRVGMIFQQPIRSLNPAFTVGDQIAETVRRHMGMSRKGPGSAAVEMLDRVQIPRAAARARVPAHVQRRHVPAVDDRDGAGVRARAR